MMAQRSRSPPESIAVGQDNLRESPGPARIQEPARIRRNTACVRCRDAKVRHERDRKEEKKYTSWRHQIIEKSSYHSLLSFVDPLYWTTFFLLLSFLE